MKIDVNKIPPEGLTLVEELNPLELDLETDTIKFRSPIKITTDISRISNVVSVNLTWSALMHTICSRCLDEFAIDFKKNIVLNYPVNKSELVIDPSTSSLDFARDDPERVEGSLRVNGESFDVAQDASKDAEPVEARSRTIDLNPQIREEIILDYPLKPLCKPNCQGLCPKCGKNLNEGKCNCDSKN